MFVDIYINGLERAQHTVTRGRSMGDVQQADPLSFIWDFRRVPCFRSSILYGIITGAALGGHTFYKKSMDVWFFSIDASLVSDLTCSSLLCSSCSPYSCSSLFPFAAHVVGVGIPMKALDRSVAGFLGMSCLTWSFRY